MPHLVVVITYWVKMVKMKPTCDELICGQCHLVCCVQWAD